MTIHSAARVSRTSTDLTHHNTLTVVTYRIRLFDPFNAPMPGAPYRVTIWGRTIEGEADGDGWLEVCGVSRQERCVLEWGIPDEVLEGLPEEVACPSPSRRRAPSGAAAARPAEPPETGAIPSAGRHLKTEGYAYRTEPFLELQEHDERELTKRRMHNLGLNWHEEVEDNLEALRWAELTKSDSAAAVPGKLRDWHDACEHRRRPPVRPVKSV